MGFIVFYEGNNGTQNIVDTFTDARGQDRAPRQNDEARSCKLSLVRVGAVISVYDSPSGSMTDDFCFIEVKRSALEYTVNSFEHTYEDDFVRVFFAHNNGLDGKVSRVRIN